MSKSRLEKFLYALYSLDSSDLPTPISRIEELYKCLVTGEEAPSFEPLSRVEKYLMAILGGYDADSLPNPLSRVEVLLYKLATGDDNLDGFDTFLSEHEELLAEIIRNGGVGGNIDIEYVLYTLSTEFNTLYNTAEKPVKSAILKGQTLVNLSKQKSITITSTTSSYSWTNSQIKLDSNLFKAGKKYFYISKYSYTNDAFNNKTPIYFLMRKKDETTERTFSQTAEKGIFTIPTNFETTDTLCMRVHASVGTAIDNTVTCDDIKIIEYQDGMENWDIPYFEGMQSVKMPVLTTTGKNLFDITKISNNITISSLNNRQTFIPNVNSIILWENTYNESGQFTVTIGGYNNGTVNLDWSYRIRFSYTDNTTDSGHQYIGSEGKSYTTASGKIVKNIMIDNPWNVNNYHIYIDSLQIEKNSINTLYEPYKSNILTVNEEVELRGIDDVKDTLDCLTGEVTQRVGEVVLDGSENWVADILGFTNTYRFNLEIDDIVDIPWERLIYTPPFVKSNTFRSLDLRTEAHNLDTEHLSGWDYSRIVLNISKEKLSEFSVDALKTYIQKNPITLQYQLATESVKTVDLSTVNKDENNTKLKTFDDITHVTLSSEALIPEAELEVATKNEEDLEDSSVYTVHTLSEEFNTLYNTAEKPVKSAILKGQTLINHVHKFEKIMPIGTGRFRIILNKTLSKPLKPNTNYLFINHSSVGYALSVSVRDETIGEKNVISNLITSMCKFTTPDSTEDFNRVIVYLMTDNEIELTYNTFMVLEYQDGMENWDIPYFEGMQSVKMPVLKATGKNLVSGIELGGYDEFGNKINDYAYTNARCTEPIYIGDGETFYAWMDEGGKNNIGSNGVWYHAFDKNKKWVRSFNGYSQKITLKEGECYIVFRTHEQHHEYVNGNHKMMISKEPITSYEPFKSNILTVNEEVELRGIGEVQDELNLLTGELIQRVSEFICDENTNVMKYQDIEGFNTTGYYITLPSNFVQNATGFICNSLPKSTVIKIQPNMTPVDEEGIVISYGNIKFRVSNEKGTNVEDFKKYLEVNPIKLIIPLVEKSVKTVDLSTVNQDENNTKLSTFNDITYVTLSSEGLIPEAELEVAEKVPEVAANMLTISREQEVINATANEQSENVDSTMIATTEIYEDLL